MAASWLVAAFLQLELEGGNNTSKYQCKSLGILLKKNLRWRGIFIFQHDDDMKHTSKSKQWFHQNKIKVLAQPESRSKSNPTSVGRIESSCAQRCPNILTELEKAFLREEGKKSPVKTCQSDWLYPKRLSVAIKSKKELKLSISLGVCTLEQLCYCPFVILIFSPKRILIVLHQNYRMQF